MASEKITAIIEELKGLTVLELSELVHAVEDEFGVSAAAAVAVAACSLKNYIKLCLLSSSSATVSSRTSNCNCSSS